MGIIATNKEKKNGNEKGKGLLAKLDGAFAVVISMLSLLLIIGRIFIFTPYQVSGLSMSPTLGDGDKIVVTSEEGYQKGDIVVFTSPIKPDDTYIKRVVGVPGDTIEIKEGKVFVNGEKIDSLEGYGVTEALRDTGELETYVPTGQLYVLGDNRENSMDSRVFGTIKSSTVKGKLACRLVPLKDFTCGELDDTKI